MLLYLIWATRSGTGSPDLHQRHQTYHSPEAIEACTKNLSCFANRWGDAIPYFQVFQFLRQKILWDSDASASAIHVPTPEEAECHLEQLKKTYLHRAILGMIEDMMYGAFVQHETMLDDFVTGIM